MSEEAGALFQASYCRADSNVYNYLLSCLLGQRHHVVHLVRHEYLSVKCVCRTWPSSLICFCAVSCIIYFDFKLADIKVAQQLQLLQFVVANF